ncbi:hypothetical protein [Rhodococcus sp. PAMC28705]|uniref:hypothetical protein n=1 Tax=Rhodococcus sp. PAMC28705 TaxID=2565561 RepID=UPI001B351DE5|nr:hypothetical protein [Rhodococcus sp. PAMC28705]
MRGAVDRHVGGLLPEVGAGKHSIWHSESMLRSWGMYGMSSTAVAEGCAAGSPNAKNARLG